jgi:hypothetical protein
LETAGISGAFKIIIDFFWNAFWLAVATAARLSVISGALNGDGTSVRISHIRVAGTILLVCS